MGERWTNEQLKVIEHRGSNLLVAASAGSGKTAVLVERLIKMITDMNDPVPAEKLLVLTFTNAAAAEMKERIEKGIDALLYEDPGNEFLQSQKTALAFAHISTIHSLCLDIIRDHFDLLDIDPSFRTGDESEIKLLKKDVASDVLETFYAGGDESFRTFSSAYAHGKSDEALVDMIIRLYDFSRGQPSPEHYLKKCRDAYISDQAVDGMFDHIFRKMQRTLKSAYDKLDQAENMLSKSESLAGIKAFIKNDRLMIASLVDIHKYEELFDGIKTAGWPRFITVRSLSDGDKSLKDAAKKLRDDAKKMVEKLKSDYSGYTRDSVMHQMEYVNAYVHTLTSLVSFFADQYQKEKKDRNLIDFSDQEHLALKVLVDFSEDEDGNLIAVPTRAAEELSGYFAEVICDEYQDTNPVQEMILEMLSGNRSGKHNRFMVGDVKQSIYGFRLADASIFMDKYDNYPDMEGCIRIDLQKNFRSRKQVLDSINFCFRKLMKKEVCGIEYDLQAELVSGRQFPDHEGKNAALKTEIILADYDEDIIENEEKILSVKEVEALVCAKKIKELTDPASGLDILDDDTGEYRKARYGDIVILLRSTKEWSRIFAGVLSDKGIPVSTEVSEGFFMANEVQMMLSLLSVIDNPYQDIPLAAVMTSPFAGFTDEELAMIRIAVPEGWLYDAVRGYPESEDECSMKIRKMISLISSLREASSYMSVDELLQKAYDMTGYYDYVRVLPQGKKRKANLDQLAVKAAEYASGSMNGLFNFNRYIEQLKSNSIDFGEAASYDGTGGAVRIMSIHKSKGLEFPVVLLSAMGKEFNTQDTNSSLVMHKELGIGMDAVNPVTNRKARVLYKKYLSDVLRQETKAEEQRILYVAMTRAKEQLIMTGCVKSIEKAMERWEAAQDHGILPDHTISSAGSYLDWIMPCIIGDPDSEKYIKPSVVSIIDLIDEDVASEIKKEAAEDLLHEDMPENEGLILKEEETLTDVDDIIKRLDEDKAWAYPWMDQISRKEKYTVSELKKEAAEDGLYEEETMLPGIPSSPDGDSGTADKDHYDDGAGAIRGTAYHRVMELIDIADMPEDDSRMPEWTEMQLKSMVLSGRLYGWQADLVGTDDIISFLRTDLAVSMKKAALCGRLHRETPFMMGLPSDVTDPLSSDIPEEFPDDLVLIQGVIDAWYETDDGIILIDYKTDRVRRADGEKVLSSRYKKQLDYYEYAIYSITRKKVSKRLIYSFSLKKAFEV